MIGVREAAMRLDVSPRRVLQRIEDGSLPATRVGTQWAIDPARLPLAAPRPSRALSPKMAWSLLGLLAGDAPQVTPTELRRLDRYAHRLHEAPDPATLLRTWMARRADRREYRAARPDLDDLRGDERLVRSGISADAGNVVRAGVEGYASPAAADALADDYALVEALRQEGNVVLHVLDDVPARIAWPVHATDLAEHLGSRESARANEMVREHETTWRRPSRGRR